MIEIAIDSKSERAAKPQSRRPVRGAVRALTVALGAGALVAPSPALAQSKEACVEAHGRGQELREARKLTDARDLFITCAQSSCPALIQADCARFGEELERNIPTVSFAARDAEGRDIVDAAVFVDNVPVTARLDGRSYPANPGHHTIRFVHDGRSIEQTVILSQGEKGRLLSVTFGDPKGARGTPQMTLDEPAPTAKEADRERPSRSALPLVLAGAGALGLTAGVAMIVAGNGQIPSNCTWATNQCKAKIGDPVFEEAKSGARWVNIGFGVAAGGAAAIGVGLVWRLLQDDPADSQQRTGIAPWVVPGAGGVDVIRAF